MDSVEGRLDHAGRSFDVPEPVPSFPRLAAARTGASACEEMNQSGRHRRTSVQSTREVAA